MKYFGESNKYYLQAFVSSSFILGAISIVVYKSEISVLLMLFAVGWVYLDFKEAYSKIKIPIIVTNSEGIKVNFTLIDKKLIKWKDIISFKKGYLGVYKLIHKNGQKALLVGFLNQRDREHLFNLISSNIKSYKLLHRKNYSLALAFFRLARRYVSATQIVTFNLLRLNHI